MTPAEIIAIAKEVDIDVEDEYEWMVVGLPTLSKFAALVAAKEREACAALEYEAGVYSKHDMADAIRARGQS